MPPRVRLTAEESEQLPMLLSLVAERRNEFPLAAEPARQACWVAERYGANVPLTINLITLLLFEHGVHRSVDQVARDLAILRGDTSTDSGRNRDGTRHSGHR